MDSQAKINLEDVQVEINEIKSAPLSEHSVRFASVNQELARKLQEIEST